LKRAAEIEAHTVLNDAERAEESRIARRSGSPSAVDRSARVAPHRPHEWSARQVDLASDFEPVAPAEGDVELWVSTRASAALAGGLAGESQADRIYTHWCSSGFANTDLDALLKAHGIRKLIVLGLIAHTSVEIIDRVDALGPGVERWTIGERVGVGWHGGYCGQCDRAAAESSSPASARHRSQGSRTTAGTAST